MSWYSSLPSWRFSSCEEMTIGASPESIVTSSVSTARCRWVIDTLKKTVPIWKKEQFVDGAAWADGEPFPDDLPGTAQ